MLLFKEKCSPEQRIVLEKQNRVVCTNQPAVVVICHGIKMSPILVNVLGR